MSERIEHSSLVEKVARLEVAVALLQEENLHLKIEKNNLKYHLVVRDCLSTVRDYCIAYIDSKYSTQFGNNLPPTFTWKILTMVHNGTLSPAYPMSDALRNAVVNCETWINEYLTDPQCSCRNFLEGAGH